MITPKIVNDVKVIFGPCRLSYPSLFEKKKFDGDAGDGKYMVTVLIPKSEKETINALNNAIEAAKTAGITAKWKGKLPAKLALPMVDGDDTDDEYQQGHFTIKAKSNMRPAVTDINGNPIVDEEEIYGGVWAFVSVSFYAYNAAGNTGVAATINGVKKFKDDERFGQSSAHDFDGIGIDDEDDDDL